MQITVNGQTHDIPPLWQEDSLLFVLRELLGLTGTKYGCGVGSCGACTVQMDGEAVRSCITPAAAAEGTSITTIEGLGGPEGSHPLQRAWLHGNVAQCGYCQAGQIMQAAALLAGNSSPSNEEIDQAMAGNLCRCGTYGRIRQAIRSTAKAGVGT